MRKLSIRQILVPVFVLALLLAACGGGGGHQQAEVYYLVVVNSKIAYWQEAAAGLSAAAKSLGVRYEVAGPETYDAKEQKEAFRRVLAKKPTPAGILVSAADPNLMQPEIDAAVAQGIPVITVDADAPKSKRLFFIGTNNYEAGQMGADLLVKELGGKGKVVAFTIPGQENLEERLEGYKRVLARYPAIQISEVVDMKGDAAVAFDAAKRILEGKTPPEAFICLEALACSEVAEVMDRGGISGKLVIAMDTDKNTLEWIKKGKIKATIAQKPYTMTYFGLRMLGDMHQYKPARLDAHRGTDPRSTVPVFVDTGAALVDASNLSQYAQP